MGIARSVFRHSAAESGITVSHVLAAIERVCDDIAWDRIREPAIADTQIMRPVFITGLPRSGTTFLHRLLEARGLAAPHAWEMMSPSPPPSDQPDPVRVARCGEVIDAIPPELAAMHETAPTAAEECGAMTLLSFNSANLLMNFDLPAYQDWFYAATRADAYRMHRQVLQHLQYRSGRSRWVLKSPEHLFDLDALFDQYPDATVFVLRRNLDDVLPSLTRLMSHLRALHGCTVNPGEPDAFCAAALDRYGNDQRVTEIQFTDLIAQPQRVTDMIMERI